MLDFNNTQKAFASKSKLELYNAYVLFSTISNRGFVNFLNSATGFALKNRLPLGWAVKPTLYKQFVGGETLESCSATVENLFRYGIYSVLDYSAEGSGSHEDVVNSYKETLKSVDYAAKDSRVAFAVFKLSAFIPVEVLDNLTFPGYSLSETDKRELDEFKERVFSVCARASEKGVRVLIDAEDFASQNLFDSVAEEAMKRFNKQRAVVFHTLQMYRKDRGEYLRKIHKMAVEEGFVAGVKFVRGAYMEEERERALRMGYPSPIHDTKEDTDNCYNDGLKYTIENIANFELFSGTHNYESNLLLPELMKNAGLERDDKRVFFSQLYGMSDNISFNLASEGYNVCKYIPYAPVEKVLPYLLRRARENTSMAGQTGRELALLKTELARRGGVL
ncbi:MAG: proline dehydrogenase family protein [Bacteroidales bacterium]